MQHVDRKSAMSFVLPGCHSGQKIYESVNSLVYRAIREQDDQPVILKMLKPDYPQPEELTRYKQEYEITRRLDAAGVIKVYGLESYHQTLVLILEDFGGVSLNHLLEEWKRAGTAAFSLSQFLKLASQIVAGVAQLHAVGVIHKHLTPANIVFNPDTKELKLIDFGLATVLSREIPMLKNPQGLEGTLAYLSPEQTGRMNRTVDYRTDFYSLGVTFYELLTGRLPFEATDAMELVHCHLAKMPDTPPHALNPAIPVVLSDLVLKLMAKAPEDRYQSARGLKHDLNLCLQYWQAHERIPAFKLGQRDRADHFLIPEKLYGRETEVKTLLAAFGRVMHGRAELILVTGFSGIGKTAVIHEVHKPIVRQHGYFIKGKFDQFNRNIPFSAFVQALRDLMGQLLGESDAQLEQWKIKILNELGENGQVIIDVIPELERIIGPQPAVPELSGNAAQNRFNLLFQKFIATFTTSEHPLVIFLDDLQWVDLASLKLIHLLMSVTHESYLLLVGAYRDNEVSPTHPLRTTLDEIEKSGATLNTITLPPLLESDINQLIADTLSCTPELALPLVKMVYQKTKGNPFFNNQFLKTLYEEGMMNFNFEGGYWQCDIAQVSALALTDDVVEFMAEQLQKLSQRTQEVLKLAACIGNSFDLGMLAVVYQQSQVETAVDLWQAVQEGFVLPQSEIYQFFQDSGHDSISNQVAHVNFQVPTYRFLHDRVQQGAYSLIAEDQKQSTHLQIGQLLLHNSSATEREERLFEIVNHLNAGSSLITQLREREELSQLNLMAGQKAKAATAYAAAIDYLTAGINLLPPDGWEQHYTLTLALHVERLEAAYLNTNFEQLGPWGDLVLQHAKSLLDEIPVHETRLMAARSKGLPLVALDIGLQVLRLLGIEFPDQLTPTDIGQVLEATRQLWEGHLPLSLIDLPPMSNPYCLAAMQVMAQLSSPAYLAAPALMPLLICKQVELSIQSGNCPISAFSYADYGVLLCGVIGDLEVGYEFGQLALKVLERFQATSGKSRIGHVVQNFIRHWKDPLRELLPPLREAYQSGLATGDLENVAFNAQVYCYYSYFAGLELAGLAEEMEAYCQTVRQIKQESTLKYLEIVQQVVLNLLGGSEVPWELTGSVYNAEQSLPLHQANRDRTALFHFYFHQTVLYYLFGQYSQAAQQSALVEQHLDGGLAQFSVTLYFFYDSLIHLVLYEEATGEEQRQILERVEAHQERMQRWAALAPFNHQHHWKLVEAERHAVLGERLEAMECYDLAIAAAKENGYVQDEAFANELAAKFYLGWGKEKVAQAYMQDAYDCYNRWGASAKVKQLEQHYPQLLASILTTKKRHSISDYFTSRSTLAASTAGAPLDLVTVIKASQAITGEIELARLLTQMMRIVIENVGAQRGALILERDGEWVIEAQGDVSSREIAVLQALDLWTSATVSSAIVAHVARTRTSVVLDDAGSVGDFTHDPYITQHRVKSVICAPLVNQGQLSGIVYLENNLATKAFTAERLELLNLLSTQMALSLDNARLYQQAQQEIAERKLTEAALRESEERFRLFMHHFPGLVYIKDSATCHLFANQGFKTYLNLTPSEVLGKTNQDIYPPEIAKRFTTGDLRVIESEQNQEIEEQHGERIWSTYKFAIPQPDRPSLIGGFTLDITERKRAEQALQAKTEELDRYFTSSLDLLCIADTDGYFHRLNPEWETTLGYTIAELEGRQFLELVHPEDVEATIAAISQLKAQQQVLNFENRYRCKDGSYRWIEWRSYPIGKMIYAVARDITEHKKAEEALKASETRYRRLYETMMDAFASADMSGRIQEANPAYQAMFGYSLEELCQLTYMDLTPENWRPVEARIVNEQVLTQGFSDIYEKEHIKKDGTVFPTEVRAFLLRDDTGQPIGMAAILRDITERKRAEAEREKLIAELEARNAELERFTYTVSHDLKSPLITIRGFLGYLTQDALSGNVERLQADIARITDATNTMQHLLNDLLELSRIGRLMNPPEVAPFEAIVLEALKRVECHLTAREVQVEIVPGLPMISGDQPRLVEVVQNLVDNAIKFMGNQPKPQIKVGVKQQGDETLFYVADNGIGIVPQYHEKIFGLFERLNSTIEGTGVGLALAKRIVEVHGGNIWVESEGQGTGSTFYFTLPLPPGGNS